MTRRWHPDDAPDRPMITAFGYVLALVRGGALLVALTFGLLLLLLIRLIERPLWGLHRPITPHITQMVCRVSLAILGVRLTVNGKPMAHAGAMVANHSSWVDIFALNAASRVYFVSKAEVANWPGIGWLARATGTVFIERKRQDAKIHGGLIETRLYAGHRLLIFPEGTSTDGSIVLPFKSTLFAPFLMSISAPDMWIQPVRIVYDSPRGHDPRFYGWWGDMEFGPHAMKLLAIARIGHVEIYFQPPVQVANYSDRKILAKACEDLVRVGAVLKGS